MKFDQEIKKQLEEDNLPPTGKDADLYKVVFDFLGRGRESQLSESFVDNVVSGVFSPVFTWREITVFLLLAALPILGFLYWSDTGNQILHLPVMEWVNTHIIEIVFGILMIAVIQIVDRYLIRHFL